MPSASLWLHWGMALKMSTGDSNEACRPNWIVGPDPGLLSATQIAKVEAQAASRLGLAVSPLSQLTAAAWFPVFRQIYSDVERHGKPARGDTFNGLYGLNRGLCAAALALAVAALVFAPNQWIVGVGLLGVSLDHMSA